MKDSHGVIDLQLTDLKLDNVDVIEALALDLQVDADSWSALLKDKQPVHAQVDTHASTLLHMWRSFTYFQVNRHRGSIMRHLSESLCSFS